MFKVFLAIIGVSSLLFAESTIEDYYKLSEQQRVVLKQTHTRASKDGLGYTLAAIQWKESQAGDNRINLNLRGEYISSVDLGSFHLNSKSFLVRWYREHPKIKRTHFLDNVLLHKITVNDAFSLIYATKELLYWKKRGRVWSDTVRSYNCGYNINRRICNEYYLDIRSKMHVLETIYKGLPE